MFQGNSKFLLPVFLFSIGAYATVPEGDEAYLFQKVLKDKNMNLCSEELRERPGFVDQMKQFNLELGAIISDAQQMNSFPDDVGDPTFRLDYDKDNDWVEIYPGGRRDSDASPLLVLRASEIEPEKLARIKDAGGLHVEEVMGDGTGQAAILGPGGTSPALVRLLTDNLNLFCVKGREKSGGDDRTNILSSAMNELISEEGAQMGEAVMDESKAGKKKKAKFGRGHHRRR